MGYSYEIYGHLQVRDKWHVEVANIQKFLRKIGFESFSVQDKVCPIITIGYNYFRFDPLGHNNVAISIVSELFDGYIIVIGENFVGDDRLYKYVFKDGKATKIWGVIEFTGYHEEVRGHKDIAEQIQKYRGDLSELLIE